MKKFKDREQEGIKEIYDMVSVEIEKFLNIVSEKTGYYTTGKFSLFSEPPKKCMDIDLRIALLEEPHEPEKSKVEYYKKANPDNVLDAKILAYEHNSWYMIYDGVHRTNARRELGHDTVKADILIPPPEL